MIASQMERDGGVVFVPRASADTPLLQRYGAMDADEDAGAESSANPEEKHAKGVLRMLSFIRCDSRNY